MKLNRNSIGVKLWLYFLLFASAILLLLWLMQIVFLQSFYKRMKTNDIVKIAGRIVDAYGNEDFTTIVDALSFHNTLLVFVTDTEGNVLYVSDEHGFGGRGKSMDAEGPPPDRSNPFRMLPNNFDGFLDRLLQSEDGSVSYIEEEEGRFRGRYLVYGAELPDAVLYIRTPFEALNATTGILHAQLVYVTIASLLLSLVIALFIARRFSRPIGNISRQAAELAGGNFDVTFGKGFCAELDELAATLDHTAKELSKVEALRRELIANISHDLRTPLTMIKAYTEMIRDFSGDDKRKREEHLAVIGSETERLVALVNDILELSSIQSGGLESRFENVDLSGTTQRVLSSFAPLAEHDGYAIRAEIEPDQYVHADGQRLEQVLYNLIGNAVNYIGEDKLIRVTLTDLGGRVRFEVSDGGEGIPEEDLPHIWDRYYKAKNQKRAAVGTGLGLSIVKGILEAHGASFGVNSNLGEGSTFWFELRK